MLGGKVVAVGCEEEVIASGQITSREGEEGGNKGGEEEEEGEVDSSEERGSLSLFSLSQTYRLLVSFSSCLLGFSHPLCAGG